METVSTFSESVLELSSEAMVFSFFGTVSEIHWKNVRVHISQTLKSREVEKERGVGGISCRSHSQFVINKLKVYNFYF